MKKWIIFYQVAQTHTFAQPKQTTIIEKIKQQLTNQIKKRFNYHLLNNKQKILCTKKQHSNIMQKRLAAIQGIVDHICGILLPNGYTFRTLDGHILGPSNSSEFRNKRNKLWFHH